MQINTNKSLSDSELVWLETRTFIDKILTRLEKANCRIEGYQIDGSLASGLCVDSVFNDIDVILFIANEVAIDENFVNTVASTLGTTKHCLLSDTRFGEMVETAHIMIPAISGITTFKAIDLWLVHAPFITMSPVWDKLFSEDEIAWQREIRYICSKHLSSDDYKIIKAAQLCEARWRYCANYALPMLNDFNQLEQLIMYDLPIKNSPCTSIRKFLSEWLSGSLRDSWCSRPLTQFPSRIKETLGERGLYQRETPAAPAWTVIAGRIQNKLIQNYYAILILLLQ